MPSGDTLPASLAARELFPSVAQVESPGKIFRDAIRDGESSAADACAP